MDLIIAFRPFLQDYLINQIGQIVQFRRAMVKISILVSHWVSSFCKLCSVLVGEAGIGKFGTSQEREQAA